MKSLRAAFVTLLLALSLPIFLSGSAVAPAGATPAYAPGAQEMSSGLLYLAVGVFDPLSQVPALPEALQAAGKSDGTRGYYILQFAGPIYESERAVVAAQGVELLDYLPDFAFIARMDGAVAAGVRGLPNVRWIGPLLPGYRIEPDLAWEFVGSGRNETLALTVSVFPGESLDAVVQQLRAWGGSVGNVSPSELWPGLIRVQIAADRLADIAGLSAVEWVEATPELVWHEDQVDLTARPLENNSAADIMNVRAMWTGHSIYGSTQIAAACDSGLDQGSMAPASLHDDFENGSGVSRVIAITDMAGDGNVADTVTTHGTHTSGSILGNGDQSGSTPSTHTYPSTAFVGMAPEARYYFQACGNATGGVIVPIDLAGLFAPAYTNGARVHSNSWGSALAGTYDALTRTADQYLWGQKDMVVTFSAGNSGVDWDANGVINLLSLGRPATAKNVITVGASENVRPPWPDPSATGYDFVWSTGSWAYYFPVAPFTTDHVSNNSLGMAAFSSRGPTKDGRIKPDIVAPGTNVLSTRSSLSSDVGWGAHDSYYVYNGGTSMSNPLAAGAGVLAREYFETVQTYSPSAAMVKAALVNGARDIYPGQYGTGTTQEVPTTRPTNVAGWGRVNLEPSLFPAGPRRSWFWDQTSVMTSSLNSLTTGQSASYSFEITQTRPFSVTLAWTDYPGALTANGALVNDLDVSIAGPGGTTYYPNYASQRGPTQYLYNDDTRFEGPLTGGANWEYAVRLTPASFPVTVDKAQFYLYKAGGLAAGAYNFTALVYDDNGTGGLPGTSLCSTAGTARFGSTAAAVVWVALDMSTCNGGAAVSILSGSFYIAYRQTNVNLLMEADVSAPISGLSYYNTGAAWTQDINYEYAIRGVVTGNNYVTSHDRVNNLNGIDIASPTTGVYTITVSGYNVPNGPQPYALVVSSVGRPLGTETVTRTVSATGTNLKFGNTGVTMNFNSENITTAGVTVQRDRICNTPTADMVKRCYDLRTTGGTGAFNVNLTFSYEDAELGSLNEAGLQVYRWTGSGWVQQTVSSRDPAHNALTVNNVTTLSTWVIGVSTPTALELGSADVQQNEDPLAIFIAVGLVITFIVGLIISRRRR